MNLIFVSYAPGAKGKFVTELCSILLTKDRETVNVNLGGGNIRWNQTLGSNDYFKEYPNGIFPEQEHYKEYIKQIEDTCLAIGCETLCIDTHYMSEETVEYLLERGHKVIRIFTTQEDSKDLQNNFFYKNFMYKLSDSNIKFKLEDALNIAKTTITSADKLEEFADVLQTHLHLWSKQQLTSLFDTVGSCTSGRVDTISDRPNLLNLKYSGLNDTSSLLAIPKFLNVEPSNEFLLRCESYIKEQTKITNFDNYIDLFLNIESKE